MVSPCICMYIKLVQALTHKLEDAKCRIHGKKHDALYSYLISLAGIEADYVSEYCHW